jgi:hypothetical protein
LCGFLCFNGFPFAVLKKDKSPPPKARKQGGARVAVVSS